MPRGVRRSQTERLQDEIKNAQDTITQYKSAIKTQEEKLKQLKEELQMEELKEVSAILEEKNMTVAELKDFLNATETSPKDE